MRKNHMIRLREKYQKEVVPALMKKFGYKNIRAVPKIEKVVLNTGFGKQIISKGSDEQKKQTEYVLEQMALIAGQRPVLTIAKKSIASFKLRQGMAIGAAVTLRKKKM